MDTWKGIGVRKSHEGVMGSHMGCTKMNQNGHHIMTEQKCFEFVLSDLNDRFSGLNGHLKGDRSQYKSWRGHRVTHKMHQNAPKWSPYHDRAKVFRICAEWLIWSFSGLNGHLKGDRSQYKPWRGHGFTHEVHQNAPQFWSILVHFGAIHVWPHDPSMTCPDSYPLSSVHLIQKKII